MLNPYPERSPKPSQLSAYDAGFSALNCAAIEQVLVRHGATEVLGARGNMPHKTLKRAKLDIRALLDRLCVRVFTWDSLTKQGDPRHPSPPEVAADAGAEGLRKLTATRTGHAFSINQSTSCNQSTSWK